MSIPRATYRLQLGPTLDFDGAAELVDHVAALGVSHLYLSPILQAGPGSTHGYDVADPTKISDDLGGADGLRRLANAAAAVGLGLVVDIVPNHLAARPENPWWWDVLEHGPASVHAAVFDIDWDPPDSKLRNRVLVPVLGDHLGRVLQRGEIHLVRQGPDVEIRYAEHRLPLAPRSLAPLLEAAATIVGSDLARFVADSLGELPEPSDASRWRRRRRDHAVLRSLLEESLERDLELAAALDDQLRAIEIDPTQMADLLDHQNHRLAFWRTGDHDLDYRRFFDIDQLVGVRVENPAVFEVTHRVVLDLVEEGVIDGLRIDHPDGLRDPATYLERLQEATGRRWCVVEKILEPGEELRDWPVAGTTGYDFARLAMGVLIDPAAEQAFDRLNVELTGDEQTWAAKTLEAKREMLVGGLAADVGRLVKLFGRVCEATPEFRDYTRPELHDAVVAVVAGHDVYRTYRQPEGNAGPEDRAVIDAAIERAREAEPDIDPDLLGFLGRILAGGHRTGPADELGIRVQQLTGATMAKGVEDTAGYRESRFVGLAEVGGDPSGWSVEVSEFHAAMAHDAARWPATLRATSTHDTKRSEDVRARLLALAEFPERWSSFARRWMEETDRDDLPDAGFRYRWLQILVGAHPLPPERGLPYAGKAAREAKQHTSWTDPDPDYEAALARLVDWTTTDPAFAGDLEALVAEIGDAGWSTALAQVVLKLTVPGVPDIYQGTEAWDLSLVDPDNRRAVDWAKQRRLLASALTADVGELWDRREDGAVKTLVTHRILRLRTDQSDLFAAADHVPLAADGPAAAHSLAFHRGGAVTAIVTRLPAGLAAAGGWRDTSLSLPPGRHRDVFTDRLVEGSIRLGALLDPLPVAVLSREEL